MAFLLVPSVFGLVYGIIGILTGGFLQGACLGVHAVRYLRSDAGAWMQVGLAAVFAVVSMYFPWGIFVFPILAGFAGGNQFAVYAAMAGEKDGGKIYAADVIGAACGVFFAGLFLIPIWGMLTTMFFVAALNLVMVFLLRRQPRSVSADL